MRDLVIGVTVVLADGTIASSGGKVVKNVAGYDLGKLFSGSRGRLGLIARVGAAAPSAAGGAGDRRRRDRRSARAVAGAPALAARAVARSTSCRRAGSRCSSRAAKRAVDAQVEACPGSDARTRPSGTRRPRFSSAPAAARSFDWQDLPARAARGRGSRSSRGRASAPWSPLAERVRAAFDPDGVLV